MTILRQPAVVRWQAVLIAAGLFTTYAYFPDTMGGWNQDSRFGLTRALAEAHRVYTDGYDRNSGDRAFWHGHYYSSKAPGLALSAVPVWGATALVLRALGRDPVNAQSVDIKRYVATLVCVALPSALTAALLFLVAISLGASNAAAGFAAIALGLATPFWCYATLFWAHDVAAALLFAAFAGIVALAARPRSTDLWLPACVAFTAAWAVLTDFPAAPPAGLFVLLMAAHAKPAGRVQMARVVSICCFAALPAAVLLFGYNALAFGSPLRLGYGLEAQQNWPEMKHGLLGVMYPQPSVLYAILFGRFRGLLPLAPIIAVTPLGFMIWMRRAESRAIAFVAAAIAGYYVLLNGSMENWTGGWTYGPRYIAPALPFLCLALAVLWTASSRPVRALLGALVLYGVTMSLIAVSTVAQPPEYVRSPVNELFWPSFRSGTLSPNGGMLAGLTGLKSLVPLLIVWVGSVALWVALDTTRRAKALDSPTARAV